MLQRLGVRCECGEESSERRNAGQKHRDVCLALRSPGFQAALMTTTPREQRPLPRRSHPECIVVMSTPIYKMLPDSDDSQQHPLSQQNLDTARGARRAVELMSATPKGNHAPILEHEDALGYTWSTFERDLVTFPLFYLDAHLGSLRPLPL